MPEEMTNQSVESIGTETTTDVDDWDLFSDDEVDTPVETEAEHEPESEPEVPTAAEFMTIKYNGAEQKLSQEEAIKLAQKGMNYDKIFGELQNLKNSQEMQILTELAKTSGVSIPQYVQNLLAFQNNAMIQKFAENLKGKYPDAPDELIQEMAKTQFEKTNAEKKHLEMTAKNTEEQANKEKLGKQADALKAEYPDVDVYNLPEEVIELAAQGETLLGAYRAYDLKKLKGELEALKNEKAAILKNQDNKRKSTGSLTNKAGSESVDFFLEGFNF